MPGEFFDVNPGKRRSGRPSRFRNYVRFSFGPEERAVVEGVRRLQEMVRKAELRVEPSEHTGEGWGEGRSGRADEETRQFGLRAEQTAARGETSLTRAPILTAPQR